MSKKTRLTRKLRERRERIRRQKHERRLQESETWQNGEEDEPGFSNDGDEGEEPALKLPSQFSAERSLLDLHKVLEARHFSSVEEINAYLSTLTGGGLEEALAQLPPPTPEERAQELAYQALDVEDDEESEALARQALELDPDCVDALATLARLTARTPRELVSNLKEVVRTGERLLGREFFEENRGSFWGITKTRPYMRARERLAFALQVTGRLEDAIREYEAMLELNPNDNQGNRDTLLRLYLLTGKLKEADRLLRHYESDYSAIFKWGRVLERYLAGDRAGARTALRKARAQNRHVELYLTARKPFPRRMPDYYSPGKDSEALHCLATIGEVWLEHPDAMMWVATEAR